VICSTFGPNDVATPTINVVKDFTRTMTNFAKDVVAFVVYVVTLVV